MTSAQHSAKDPNWTTPPWLIELIRECLGGIALDPYSSDIANLTVQADSYYTPADDGHAQPWTDRTMINPPGLLVRKAWAKLCSEILSGRVNRAAWVGFSIEQLALLADPNRPDEDDDARWRRGAFHPCDFTWVVLRKRISFVKEDGTTGSPSHANYLTFPGIEHAEIVSNFGSLGRVLRGPLSI